MSSLFLSLMATNRFGTICLPLINNVVSFWTAAESYKKKRTGDTHTPMNPPTHTVYISDCQEEEKKYWLIICSVIYSLIKMNPCELLQRIQTSEFMKNQHCRLT